MPVNLKKGTRPWTRLVQKAVVAALPGLLSWGLPPAWGTAPAPGRDGEDLPPGALVRLGSTRLRHPKPVAFLAFLPDGKGLVSGERFGNVYRWDTAGGRLTWRRHLTEAGRLYALSPDGQRVAAVSQDRVAILDAATGALLCSFSWIGHHLAAPCFSPDGKVLFVGGRDETLTVWDTATGQEVRRSTGRPKWAIESLALSHDGKTLAGALSGPRESELCTWDAATFKKVVLARSYVYELAFSRDGRMLAVVRDRQIGLHDFTRGTEVRVLAGHTGEVTGLDFSPDGKTLYSAGEDGTARAWDTASGKERLRLEGYPGFQALALSADGALLATGGTDGLVRLWDARTGQRLEKDDAPPGAANSITFSPDGRRLASVGLYDFAIRVWDAATGRELRRIDTADLSDGKARRAAFAPDGKTLAAGGFDGVVRLWDLETGRTVARCQAPQSAGLIAFSADGRTLVTADSWGPFVRLWDVASGQQRKAYRIPGCDRIRFAAFSPATMTFSTANPVPTGPRKWVEAVQLWDAARGTELMRGTALWRAPHWLDLSADGWIVAIGINQPGISFDVVYHDTVTGEIFGGPSHRTLTGLFSPDGRRLAAAPPQFPSLPDETVRVWDVTWGEELAVFKVGGGGCKALAFSPDGQRLATATQAGSVLVWDLSRLPAPQLPRFEPLTPKRFEVLWQKWGEPEQVANLGAHLTEVDVSRDKAVALLKAGLRPAATPDLKRVKEQIERLGHQDDEVGEAARKELARDAGLLEPVLRQARQESTDPKTLAALEELLKRPWFVQAPDQLRAVRGVQVLERAGTPEAVAVLKELATGWEMARPTRYARAALDRLEKAAKATPSRTAP